MHGAATRGPSEENSAGKTGEEDQDLKDLQLGGVCHFFPSVLQPGLDVAGNPHGSCGGTSREHSGEDASSGMK